MIKETIQTEDIHTFIQLNTKDLIDLLNKAGVSVPTSAKAYYHSDFGDYDVTDEDQVCVVWGKCLKEFESTSVVDLKKGTKDG